MFKLGWTLKDKITGFKGVVTGRCEYISGCHQVLLVPAVSKTGDHREGHWFDEQRCERVGGSEVTLNNGRNPGFDKEAPKR
jgi:hypothetical protein